MITHSFAQNDLTHLLKMINTLLLENPEAGQELVVCARNAVICLKTSHHPSKRFHDKIPPKLQTTERSYSKHPIMLWLELLLQVSGREVYLRTV